MPEKFISHQEEQNAATMLAMQERVAQRTPEEAEAMLTAGIDALVSGEQLKDNREFYERMAGVAVVRATVHMDHSNEVYATARQLYGPLGYDTSPRKIRKM